MDVIQQCELPGYDLIGDIHGYAQTLKKLLEALGYTKKAGVYSHELRKVIFLGDYIDRGPHQEETIEIVRSMVAAEKAYAIMGNHEYNAITFFSRSQKESGHLRPRNEKNRRQHQAFLNEFESRIKEWSSAIEWFKTLPLWLDFESLRAIHACWDEHSFQQLKQYSKGGQWLSDALLNDSAMQSHPTFDAVETLLKGKEVVLPNQCFYHDKEGVKRHRMRVRWWDGGATTFQHAFIGPEQERTHIPEDPISGDHLIEYQHKAPPLFLGHYWLSGQPTPLASNIACLDYSVAKSDGKLMAYRWSGEAVLLKKNFQWVQRLEA